MSTARTPEIATRLGGLDDSAFRDGGAGAAQYLRVMAMQANRLITHAEPFVNLVWDSSTDGGAGDDGDSHNGVCTGFGYPNWVQILPSIVATKRPGMRAIDARIVAKVTNATTCYLGVSTSVAPITRSSRVGDSNVCTIAGNGAFALYSLNSSPIATGDPGEVTLYMMGVPTATAANTATYGAPSSGTLTQIGEDFLEDAAATWNSEGGGGATLDDGGHVVLLQDANGQNLIPPRSIVRVMAATQIVFWPRILQAPDAIRFLHGASYKIRKLPDWRLASVALYTTARTT